MMVPICSDLPILPLNLDCVRGSLLEVLMIRAHWDLARDSVLVGEQLSCPVVGGGAQRLESGWNVMILNKDVSHNTFRTIRNCDMGVITFC